MSWDIDRETKHDCPCGESTYTIQERSDDWGRSDERWIMNCVKCKDLYKLKSDYIYRGGIEEEIKAWIRK